MKQYLWVLLLLPIVIGLSINVATAQFENNSQNNSSGSTTAAVTNLTNASSSIQDAKNMSVIEGTTNQTGP
jgi:hypothetical protein